MCRRKVRVVPPEKNWGPKDFYICSVFRRLRHLMANICWTKHDTDNQARVLESAKGLLRCCKISWTLVHKRLKTGPEVLPTLTIYAIASSGLKWQYIAIIATFFSFWWFVLFLSLFASSNRSWEYCSMTRNSSPIITPIVRLSLGALMLLLQSRVCLTAVSLRRLLKLKLHWLRFVVDCCGFLVQA